MATAGQEESCSYKTKTDNAMKWKRVPGTWRRQKGTKDGKERVADGKSGGSRTALSSDSEWGGVRSLRDKDRDRQVGRLLGGGEG